MTIDLHRNRIYHFDENRNIKEHFAFSTNFSHFEVLENEKVLVIENYYGYENGEKSNLYCINKNIEVEWFAEVGKNQEGNDKYVGSGINGKRIFANTWNGFRIELNPENGKIIEMVFTK